MTLKTLYFAVLLDNTYHITQADSDYQAARKIKEKTGQMVKTDAHVKGPFMHYPAELETASA